MIDEDFSPDRTQLRALGHLLCKAQQTPLYPAMRESALYEKVYGRYVGHKRQDWLAALKRHRLVQIAIGQPSVADYVGESPVDVCLTPEGIYYSIARAGTFSAQAKAPTDEFPDEIVDTPWAIQLYYSTEDEDQAPAADRLVRFDDNSAAFEDAVEKLDAVTKALRSDNEIGANAPTIRDEMLLELQKVRGALEKGEGWSGKIVSLGWGVLGYLMTQFADRPVGYLAEQAWTALQTLLGFK